MLLLFFDCILHDDHINADVQTIGFVFKLKESAFFIRFWISLEFGFGKYNKKIPFVGHYTVE